MVHKTKPANQRLMEDIQIMTVIVFTALVAIAVLLKRVARRNHELADWRKRFKESTTRRRMAG